MSALGDRSMQLPGTHPALKETEYVHPTEPPDKYRPYCVRSGICAPCCQRGTLKSGSVHRADFGRVDRTDTRVMRYQPREAQVRQIAAAAMRSGVAA